MTTDRQACVFCPTLLDAGDAYHFEAGDSEGAHQHMVNGMICGGCFRRAQAKDLAWFEGVEKKLDSIIAQCPACRLVKAAGNGSAHLN